MTKTAIGSKLLDDLSSYIEKPGKRLILIARVYCPDLFLLYKRRLNGKLSLYSFSLLEIVMKFQYVRIAAFKLSTM